MPSALAALWHGAAAAAAPALRGWLVLRARRGKEIPARLPERRGIDRTPRPPGRLIWMHAASVGESVSILPVLDALRARDPALHLLVTTGTVTSATLLGGRFAAIERSAAGRTLHRFVPLDVPAWGRRFLDHWRPDAVVFVESELWPNLLAECRRRRIPLALINARLSARSHARWQRVPGFARHLLDGFALVQPRGAADGDRLAGLGAAGVTAPGDLKFAAPPLPADAAPLAALRAALAGRPVWLAASTHPGEEALIFGVHRRLAERLPGLLTIIAPRHPERGERIAVEAEAAGVRASRRSLGGMPPEAGAWIVDTMGEMGLWFRLSPVVFMGKSLLPPGGGQNPLEPARLGCAVAMGPHAGNFADQVAALEGAGALARPADAGELAGWVDAMLCDPAAREAAGRAAAAVASKDADLPDRTAAALLALLPPAGRG
ncbi:MAG: 3-deoxy-D-manno-octulosonic acid transferase [Proteobacteria bacterium]|nr:3-deoxy-D-manno-octulosonic acid transferase [Pseudomonadota bacterium]